MTLKHLNITTNDRVGGPPNVLLDGHEIAGNIRGLTIRMAPQELPQVTLDIVAHPVTFDGQVNVVESDDATILSQTVATMQEVFSRRPDLRKEAVRLFNAEFNPSSRAELERPLWSRLTALCEKHGIRLMRDEETADYYVYLGQTPVGFEGRTLETAIVRACIAAGL